MFQSSIMRRSLLSIYISVNEAVDGYCVCMLPRGGGIYCLLSADFLSVTWELLKYHLERRGQGQAMKGDTFFAQRPTGIIYSSQFLTWHALYQLIVSVTDRKLSCVVEFLTGLFLLKTLVFLLAFSPRNKYCTETRFVLGPFQQV